MALGRGLGALLGLLPTMLPAHGVASSHSIKTVFVVVMENHGWADLQRSRLAPYITGTLPRLGARAARYYTPPHLHPSLPNYLWLEAGTNFGIRDDRNPAAGRQKSHLHLVALLDRAHITWRTYAESASGSGCPLDSRYPYAPRHNPMVYFDDVTDGGNPDSRYCAQHERPFSELAGDLHAGRVARYTFVVPNVCDDMHDTCNPAFTSVAVGDRWLSRVVHMITASRAYGAGGALFILWDEGARDSDGPLPMFLLSPDARRGYVSSQYYTHGSTLRTIEEIFGVRPLLGGAKRARDLRALFRRFP